MSKSYKLSISACKNETKDTCKKLDEVEKYVKTITVEHWAVEQVIDFSLYMPHKPVQTHFRLVTSDILTPEVTTR